MTAYIVPFIVICIIGLQVYFFIKNVKRMKEYRGIFDGERSWGISHDTSTGFVSGIYGSGNKVFLSIKQSINKYLGNNSGSVIDFSLLKDAVDRHCDSVENDINTLTPVPLYCGLAGTMAGVIIGLCSLIFTKSITDLLSSSSENASNFSSAAVGVNDLLTGVAWAMIASICGIFFTTVGSILFKKYKLEGESGKNTFLAWLQAKLLPELPSDTSDALNRLVKNLNNFNNTFASNTTSLRSALKEVNESYRIQGEIIKAVHDMDVMKMARANVQVLRELQNCTDKLEVFNQYLDDIHGYTDTIHKFTTLFEQESNRLHVLEEIQQYFARHKAEISKDAADVDIALRDSLRTLKENAGTNAKELNSTLLQQAEQFKKILEDERNSFEEVNKKIKAEFSKQLGQIPMLEKKLGEISEIPAKLDKLIDRVEKSNNSLANNVRSTMTQTANTITSASGSEEDGSNINVSIFPEWMKWTIVVSIILIAVACISNTAYNIYHNSANTEAVETVIDPNGADGAATDSVQAVQDTASQIKPADVNSSNVSPQQVPVEGQPDTSHNQQKK